MDLKLSEIQQIVSGYFALVSLFHRKPLLHGGFVVDELADAALLDCVGIILTIGDKAVDNLS